MTGPGTRLMALAEVLGFPHCDECLKLAAEMDQLGQAGCRQDPGLAIRFQRNAHAILVGQRDVHARLAQFPGALRAAFSVSVSGGVRYEAALRIARGLAHITAPPEPAVTKRQADPCGGC